MQTYLIKSDENDLERCGDNLTGMVKVEHGDLSVVACTRVGNGPTSTESIQQQVYCIQLLH